MWHTKEIINIIEMAMQDYGYEVLYNKKSCIDLCDNLPAQYQKEKNILKLLFCNGFGEVLVKVPFESEKELEMGLLRIEIFLQKQRIEKEDREAIIEIFRPILKKRKEADISMDVKNVITKSYSNLPFRLTIPEFHGYANRVELISRFMYKDTGVNIDTVFEKAILIDKRNKNFESEKNYALLLHGKSKNINVTIPYSEEQISFEEAEVKLIFLCSNYKKVTVSYQIGKENKLYLKQIKVCKMTFNEYEKTVNIINTLLENGITTREKDRDERQKEIEKEEIPSYLNASIQDYSNALHKEIRYLKSGRGKRYKIVDGIKINRDEKGIFTYTFELETELHLPEDAPVVVDTTNGIHSAGTVLVCEDFQIMLLLNQELGDKIRIAYLMVEPWKLLEALDNKITSLNPQMHRLAIKLLEEGPKIATTENISAVPKGQVEVVRKLKKDNIVAVWGPPGTGKTYTMAQIAKDYIKQDKSVLIVSHSNVSVDGVVKKVVEIVKDDMEAYLKSGKILRLGYVRDEELSRHPYATSFNYALSKNKIISVELDSLILKRDALKAKKKEKTEEYDNIEKKIKRIRNDIRKEERVYIEQAQVIGTTISRATVDQMFEKRQFDLVMFDEVSMAYVPQVIAAATLAKEKFMCVGDFRQLAPISQCEAAKLLKLDIFSYLKIIDYSGHMYWHPWLVLLDEQRRMHPDIADFSSKYIYKNLLRNFSTLKSTRKSIVDSKPLPGDALNLIDLSGTYCASDKNTDGSRFNILSAIISFSTAISVDKENVTNIGIIAPYAAQVRLIRAMIRDYGQDKTRISCATVHQFQGSEADVIIFDAIESYPKAAVGILMGKEPDNIMRLINVAITRAKGKLITIANVRFWNNLFKGTSHIYYMLLGYIKKNHTVISQKTKTLKSYIEEINSGKMLQIYMNEDAAIFMLENDLEKAKGRVLISLPSGKLRNMQEKVIKAISAADFRGIDIFMKSNDYASLPDTWKKYCKGTENATFPLIIIDDEVAWYGMPAADWSFKVDKTSSMITVVHTMIRIKGRNTIEMIKSLTDMESIQVGQNRRTLLKKTILNDDHNKNDAASGKSEIDFEDVIKKKEFCPECKNHMILTKNRAGTSYLKCSNKNCKKVAYLKPEFIDWYIRNYNVMCPRNDGGELKGMVGKYGPCVKCSEGHYLKPEEI